MAGQTATNEDEFRVVEHTFDPVRLGHHASIFSLSNGLLGVRSGLSEWPDGHATIIAGAFVRLPITYHERFPGFADHTDTRLLGPGITAIRITIDGQPVDFASSTIISTRSEFDLSTATVRRKTMWRLVDGRELTLAATLVVPLEGGVLAIQNHEISPVNFDGEIVVEFPIEMSPFESEDSGDPRISARARFVAAGHQETPACSVSQFAAKGRDALWLAVSQRLICDTPSALVEAHDRVRSQCGPGRPVVIGRLVTLRVSCSQIDITSSPEPSVPNDILARHERVLARFWKGAAIALPDAPELARAIRFNLLQTFLSASVDSRCGTAAKGLSGEGYEGHAFWDNEVFVLPNLALLCPERARTSLEWRIALLDRARANARAVGHPRGALYPWRTIAGDECSAHYPTAAAQYHVNAGIAFALEVYLRTTGDRDIMEQGGLDLLIETARLWYDLGHFSDRRGGAFLIHGVTGPDEYSALVDNDFYTNAMARRHLIFAADMAEEFIGSNPDLAAMLTNTLEFSDCEIADWRRAAEKMWLPVDTASGVHPQDDTFLDKPELPAARDTDGNTVPWLMRVHPMVLFRHRVAKQGDVIQAHVTAGLNASDSQISRDLAYYEPLTTHDSTLSKVAFGICSAWLGKDEQALQHWNDTAFVDIEDLHGNSDHGLHLAAMAGSWQILVCGWARLSLHADAPWLAPRLPQAWNAYAFRFRWRNSLISVAVEAGQTTYTLIDGPPIALYDHGRGIDLSSSEPIIVTAPAVRAVIFDLDGVLTDTAESHYRAWQKLADAHGIAFDRTVNEGLKGVDRPGSLQRILDCAGVAVDPAVFDQMLAEKNAVYVDSIRSFSPADLFDGADCLLRLCRRAGLKIGLASSSRNAAALIDRLGIAHWFDHVIDAERIVRGKPDPEIFIATADALGVSPSQCVGVEDAVAGITAINAAGMTSIGIGGAGTLSEADRVFPAIGAVSLSDIVGHTSGTLSGRHISQCK